MRHVACHVAPFLIGQGRAREQRFERFRDHRTPTLLELPALPLEGREDPGRQADRDLGLHDSYRIILWRPGHTDAPGFLPGRGGFVPMPVAADEAERQLFALVNKARATAG